MKFDNQKAYGLTAIAASPPLFSSFDGVRIQCYTRQNDIKQVHWSLTTNFKQCKSCIIDIVYGFVCIFDF